MPDDGGMPDAPRTARAIARAELTRAILDRAGRRLAEVGPAALSLRQVSRDLEMASSALYRYFPSRDALLTALIVEGYDDLGHRVEQADASAPRDDVAQRWRSIAHAVRDWARAEPHRYALLYGIPGPGLRRPRGHGRAGRPRDRDPAAPRGGRPGCRAARHGSVATVPPAEVAALEPVLATTEPRLEPAVGARAVVVFAALLGSISLELFGHLHRGVLDYDAHFTHVVELLAADLGLR